MNKVTKRLEVSAAHNLDLPYDSPCNGLHGHNWIINIELCSNALNDDGMIMDFSFIKKAVHGKIDHTYLNESIPELKNSTAENMCLWVRDQVNEALGTYGPEAPVIAFCSRVEIFETEGNAAVWETDVDLDELDPDYIYQPK